MVSTRNNTLTPVPTMETMQDSINELRAAIVEIKEGMNIFLISQKLVSDELNKLNNGEGTSNIAHHIGSQHQSGGGGGQTYKNGSHSYGRMTKIKFPKFSEEDVKGWIYRCNQFFKIDSIEEMDKIQLASMHVYDKALIWHQQFCKRFGDDYPWELYPREAIKRFDSVIDDPLMELKNLKQDGTVKDYHEKSESLLNRMKLSEKHAITKMQEQTIVAMKSRYGHVLNTLKSVLMCLIRLKMDTKSLMCSGQLHSLEVIINDEEDKGEESMCPLQVEVADGNSLTSSFMCKNFKWTLQGLTFMTDMMIIPLGGCEMVLEVQCKPNALPPKRSHAHHIHLLPNIPPVNIRPYRHPSNQKDAIELMVKELLYSGVIRPSQSPFSSPIVMVKKKDVFKPILRRLTLVFFDDILIYNKGETEHLHHLKCIMQVMRENTLYAKQSECTFAVPEVEYLGHVISAKGVATDKSKVQAMKEWFDYEISYKKGSENVTADALSKVPNNNEVSQMFSLITTTITSPLWEQIKASWEQDQ
ncbi:reverse transcriptase [Tanacetum coccineum]